MKHNLNRKLIIDNLGCAHTQPVPQVGVGGLVVCYTVCGAIAFQAIEITDETDDHILKVKDDKKSDNLKTLIARYLPEGMQLCQRSGILPTLIKP